MESVGVMNTNETRHEPPTGNRSGIPEVRFQSEFGSKLYLNNTISKSINTTSK